MTFSPLVVSHEDIALISLALAEDIGCGDVTSDATIPASQMGKGRIFAKSAGALCGMPIASAIVSLVDPRIQMQCQAQDGQMLSPGQTIATLEGPLRSILTAERLVLNFLQQLSGTASLTRQFVDKLRAVGSKIDVVDTRKTTPLWRRFEKYAVLCGGGVNHRFGLYDMYLIKNNHVDAAGSVAEALKRVHTHNNGNARKVAVEARDLEEVRAIMSVGADLVLLDNMDVETIRQSCEIINHRALTEITGGVNLSNLDQYAALPVDRISIGALTHSAPSLDIALHLENS
jgi:nicotinate-nucleotide pyrophosphorylase (carboxylating)